MTQVEKEQNWVIDFCRKNPGIDALNGPAHDEFATVFNVKIKIQFVGPNSCKRLMIRVQQLYKQGKLRRGRIGISGGVGWPKWVYTYWLSDFLKTHEAQT